QEVQEVQHVERDLRTNRLHRETERVVEVEVTAPRLCRLVLVEDASLRRIETGGLHVRVEDRRIEGSRRAAGIRCGRIAALLRAEDEVARARDVEKVVAGVRVLV